MRSTNALLNELKLEYPTAVAASVTLARPLRINSAAFSMRLIRKYFGMLTPARSVKIRLR